MLHACIETPTTIQKDDIMKTTTKTPTPKTPTKKTPPTKITLEEITEILIQNQTQHEEVLGNEDVRGIDTFLDILKYLSGKKRTQYDVLQKEIIEQNDYNAYSKSLIKSAFGYKLKKFMLKADYLNLSILIKVSRLNDEEIISKLNNVKPQHADVYKKEIKQILKDIQPVKVGINKFDKLIKLTTELTVEDKMKLFELLKEELKEELKWSNIKWSIINTPSYIIAA